MNIRRLLLFAGVCFLAIRLPAIGQRSAIWQERPGTWTLNVGLSASRYLGDLNERFDLAHFQTGIAVSAATTYRLTGQLALRSDLQLYYIRGTHKNTELAFNNLSFHSINPDVSVGLQYNLWSSDNKDKNVNPYGIAGIGLTYMTPMATYKDVSYSLAPLYTEGITYNRLPVILRYGVGVPLYGNERLKGSIECIYTHVLSDYLDDVSGVYADRSTMTPIAAALSDRATEVGELPNPAGAKRGNTKRNDGYLTLSVRFIFIITTPQQRNYRRMFGG